MDFKKFGITLIGIILLGLAIWGANLNIKAGIIDDLSFQMLLGTLGGLFVIALLIERFIEVFVSIWFEKETNELEEQRFSAQTEAAKSKAKKKLIEQKSKTKGTALITSFTVSILVCVAGVGLLNDIIDPADVKGVQANLLRGVDIVLTASLLAGGSDGIHQFISTLEKFFKESKERMSNK